MVTLTILLCLAIIGAVTVGTISAGFIAVFGDVIIAVLVLYWIYNLVKGKESKKN